MESPLNRIELAQHFNQLGFKLGAEIGVYAGYYSEILCKQIPDLKLYAIDTWANYPGYNWKNNKLGDVYAKAQEKLAPYNCVLIKKASLEAAQDFADGSLDFVFIDGNHSYPYVKQDIEAWTPKVRPGGIVSGHDYYVGMAGNVGVIQAVDEYVKQHNYQLQLTPWARDVPRDDRQPCWYFIKEA